MKALIILAGIYVVLEIARFIYEVLVNRNQKAMEKNILMLEENLTIANKRIQERDEDLNKWRSAYMQLKYEYDEFKNQNHNGPTLELIGLIDSETGELYPYLNETSKNTKEVKLHMKQFVEEIGGSAVKITLEKR